MEQKERKLFAPLNFRNNPIWSLGTPSSSSYQFLTKRGRKVFWIINLMKILQIHISTGNRCIICTYTYVHFFRQISRVFLYISLYRWHLRNSFHACYVNFTHIQLTSIKIHFIDIFLNYFSVFFFSPYFTFHRQKRKNCNLYIYLLSSLTHSMYAFFSFFLHTGNRKVSYFFDINMNFL